MADATREPRVSANEHQVLGYITEADAQNDKDYDLLRRLHLDAVDARATIASQAEALAAKEAEFQALANESTEHQMALLHRANTAEAALKAAREALEKIAACDGLAMGDLLDIAVAALTPSTTKEP